jgi:hypothetical protein
MGLFFVLTLVCAFLAGVTCGAWLNERTHERAA